ncbi:unnamed protein product [Haemonchus placei]|uniref:Ground-like domain-containing protein n=1 Tax=Haemonchus placei TaxID=6290 RepID=A0A0N4WPQ5_HAEPC|nr:unnamed protein product [Haemonchus placei]
MLWVELTFQEDSTISTTSVDENLDQLLPTTPIPVASSKCNSQLLKKIMLDVSLNIIQFQNITSNSSESKRKINVAAEARFGGNVDVICSRGHFSYVFSSNLYCEASKDLVTCIAFRQTASA